MSDVETQSALLLAVPAAEAAVGAHRACLDPSARHGVPAHITVLYPFLPPAEIGPRVLAGLSRLFAGVPRFSFVLDQVRWFDDPVVWLDPADESPFRALTELEAQAHPGCSPYGGVHEDVVPHLTIGHGGGPAELRAAAEVIRPQLPIAAAATEVTLMAGPRPGGLSGPPGQWQVVGCFALG
jgi:2'-5' RNA ligase